jgi:hypothetical protein
LAGSVLLAALAVAALAALGPWRRRPLGPPVVVLAVTLGTLVGDVLTGSHLELGGLLGYDAIVAGRFTGYGNLSFGLLAVSALLLTTALATAAGRRAPAGRTRPVTAAVVLGAGALTVLVVGTPALGRDFGGVLAALPGFLLLAMLLTGTRVTVTRMAAVLALAVAAVGALAFVDWLRPASERSHLGRFVEQLLTGEAWTVVSRKAQANLDILFGSPLAWLLPVALVAAVWLVRPAGGRWGGWLWSRLGDRCRPGCAGPGCSAAAATCCRPGTSPRCGPGCWPVRSASPSGRRPTTPGWPSRRRRRPCWCRCWCGSPPARGHPAVRPPGWPTALPLAARGRGPTVLRSSPVDRPHGTRDHDHGGRTLCTTPSRRSSSSSPAESSPLSARA